ncbi:MAG: hypothetical protein ACPGCR_03090 [Acholeplasmataceae bacterium]
MKLNPKLFKQISSELIETQTFENTSVEFYSLNKSHLYDRYATRGRFVVWTSDGKIYRVLVEEGYFDLMKTFYQKPVNQIWIDFLEYVGRSNRRINQMFLIPMMLLYVIAAVISSIYFPNQLMEFLIAMIVVVFIGNFIQNKVVRNHITKANIDTQQKIKDYLGEETFNEIITKQQAYYNKFFNEKEKVSQEEEKQ